MQLPDFFSGSYDEARQRFLGAAQSMGWALEKHPVSPPSPEGKELTIDVAASDLKAEKRVVITSGLHGVEGFMGSAMQLALLSALQSGELKAPRNCGVVLVHALNPYGFAWQRRTDHQNVDLNRNFLYEGQNYKGAPAGYAEVDAVLNPSNSSVSADFFIPRLLLKVPRLGWNGLKSIIASGQYQNPHGLFFGGSAESETKGIVARQLPSWIPPNTSTAVWLDLHSGLGRRGDYMLIAEEDEATLKQNPLAPSFDQGKLVWSKKSTGIYQARGSMGDWMIRRQSARRFLFLVAEFGTCGPLRVLSALRNENMASRFLASNQPRYLQAKALLQEVFAPQSAHWRSSVITHSLKIFQATLQALAANA